MMHVRECAETLQQRHVHAAELAHLAEVVPLQVDDHHVLRGVFLAREEFPREALVLRGRSTAGPGPFDRTGLDVPAADAEEPFRTRRQQAVVSRLEESTERRGRAREDRLRNACPGAEGPTVSHPAIVPSGGPGRTRSSLRVLRGTGTPACRRWPKAVRRRTRRTLRVDFDWSMTRPKASHMPRWDRGSGTIRWDRIRGTNSGPAPGPARRNRGRTAIDRVAGDETERSDPAGRSDAP